MVIESEAYLAQSKELSDVERDAIVQMIARDPECGDVIPETGGLRKVRVPAKGHGKRGGGRVVYYYLWDTVPVLLLAFFPKNEKSDLTPKERKDLAQATKKLKKFLTEKKR